MGSFGCGTGIAWSSPVLPKVKNESCQGECDLTGVSDFAADWVGPLFPLGAACAGPVAFFLLNKIGRKKTLLWLSCPMLIGKAHKSYLVKMIDYFVIFSFRVSYLYV